MKRCMLILLTPAMGIFLRPMDLVAQSAAGYYVGSINGQYAIQMQLEAGFDEGVARYWGSYFYETVGQPINLTGREYDVVELDETVGNETTGSFRGSVSGDLFEGTWTNAKKGNPMPFSLRRVATFEQLSKRTAEWSIDYRYPIFIGEGELVQLANEPISSSSVKGYHAQLEFFGSNHPTDSYPYESTRTYAVQFVHDSLVSCLITSYEFTGGAHGNSSYEVLNVGYRNGAPAILHLEDLFKPGSNFLRLLSNAGMEQMRLAGVAHAEDGSISELNESMLNHFTLSPKGFALHYAPYEVGPYAAGPVDIVIPWKRLESVLWWDGPLAPIWKGKK